MGPAPTKEQFMGSTSDHRRIAQLERELAAFRRQNAELEEQVARARQTARALRQSEKRHRTLIESINDLIFTLDLQSHFTSISPTVSRVFGYTSADLVGQNIRQFVHPDDWPIIEADLPPSVTESSAPCEFRVIDQAGTTRYVR
jgi:PAS domain S-box-containing protein